MAWNYYIDRKMSKYGAKKVTIDGQTFDSKKEGRRFQELKMLEKAGEITDLRTQVKFVLIPAQREPDIIGARGGRKPGRLLERECAYRADFVYKDKQGNTVVEDTKGYKHGAAYEIFKIKRKLMLERFRIRIKEI